VKKYVSLISFLFFSLFFSIEIVSASTASTGIYEIFIRTLPDKTSLEKYKIPGNTTITLINDTEKKGNGCDDNWFEVEYRDYKGYVCSTYLTDIVWDKVEDDTNNDDTNIDNNEDKSDNDTGDSNVEEPIDIDTVYQEELKKFPDSYKTKIEALHQIYPNAIFKAKILDVNFNNFATYQYQGYAQYSLPGCPIGKNPGLSLIEDTTSSKDGLKALDSWAYTALTDTFNTSYYGGEANRWYAPSLNTVKYYLDPRNFITNTGIFMFEELTYGGDYYLESDIEKMLKGTFMYKTKVSVSKDKESVTFAKAFIDAGKHNNLSPYFLVSRVIQEIGYSRSSMVTGTWTGADNAYYGYYNFYNINAAGKTTYDTIKNGLEYAKSMGWSNEYDAIVGGAAFISDGYVDAGQDTTYLQKFDIYGPCYGNHQYMQNIEAPKSEAYKTYSAYNNIGLLDSNFVFVIPVYTNMPTETKLDDPRNSNNYLRNLTINGTTIDNFDYQKQEYTINVSPLVSSVEIAATKSSSKSKVAGTGTFELTDVSQTKQIKVTAENGKVRTYKITVTRDANIPISISEILNTMLVNSDGTYVSSIKLNTKASDFISKAKEVDSKAEIVIKNSEGIEKQDEILGTGDSITISSGEESKKFTVVIYGDLTGDGLINSADLLKMRQQLIGNISLKDAYKVAANVTKNDQVINSADLLKVRQHLIGTISIEQ